MTSKSNSQVFGAYTKYYDLLYADKNYVAEAEYVSGLIHKYYRSADKILDIGCGTGAHGLELVKRGFKVVGIDSSEDMLAAARNRSVQLPGPSAGNLKFEFGDARTFRSSCSFDVVTSLFHVMSYQTSNEDICAAFATAAAHLKPGGLFIFDFWHGPGVLTDPPLVRVRRLEDDQTKVIRIAEPTIRSNSNTVEVNYEIHVASNGKEEVVIKETHIMRYFFLPELSLMLNKAGFDLLAEFEWMTESPPNLQTWNAVLLCRLLRT
jgi:SAM-dependent methyltransferase